MQEKRPLHWAWIILAVCFVDVFLNYSIRLGYGVVLPEMIRDLNFNRTAGGTIYNAYLLTYVIITPFTGYLTDRIGARRVIAFCLLILGLGTTLMGFAQSVWTASLFYAFAGLGATGIWTPVVTLIQRWFAFNRKGLALGILSTSYGLGFATVGFVFPWVVTNFTWRFNWYFLGAAALLMVTVNALFLRSDPADIQQQPWGNKNNPAENTNQNSTNNQAEERISLKDILRKPYFWLIGFSYMAIAYSLYGVLTFMVDFARYQLNVPLEQASSLATISGIFQCVGVLTILPLSDYLGRKKTIIISNAFILLTLAGILIVGKSWTMLCILIGCQAIFCGVTFPIYSACAGDYFPRNVIGTVVGAWTPFYGLGAMSTHWVTGVLRDTSGVYDQGFLICTVMSAIGLVLFVFVRKSSIKTPSDTR